MRAAWVLAVLLGGCMTGEIPHEDPTVATRTEPCAALEGLTFRSVTQDECGLGPDGPALCNWSLTFRADSDTRSRYDWSHSDVGEGGWVTCDGNVIETVPNDPVHDPLYEGMFDPSNLDLIWDERAYSRAL
jgi:hypothetical protein